MSASGTTPAPWRIVSEREDELKVKGPADEWVADCADGFWSDEADGWIMAEDSKGNAHLIAAAPALYDALERLAGWCSQNCVQYEPELTGEAREALAKARGEQS